MCTPWAEAARLSFVCIEFNKLYLLPTLQSVSEKMHLVVDMRLTLLQFIL